MTNQASRRTFLKLGAATAALGLTGCVDDIVRAGDDMTAPSGSEDAKLLALFSKSFTRELEESPEFMTALGMKKRYGEWSDRTDEFAVYQNKNTLADLGVMKKDIDRSALSPSMRVSYDIFLFRNELRAANHEYRFQSYAVSHFGGPHQDIPDLLINRHRIDDKSDAEAYIARIAGTGKVVDQTVTFMREQEAKGVTLPRFSYKLILDDARKAAQGSDILADFKKKVEKLDGKEKLVASAEQALRENLQPAYARFIAATGEIGSKVKTDHGVGTLPDGAAFYDQCIASHTTLKMGANEIHELGLAEVARLSAEMETVKKRLGFKGPLKAFYQDLRTNPRYLYPNDDEGRAAYLARGLELQRKAYAALPAAFGTLPKAQVEVKRMEPFMESGQTIAFYNQGAPDGSRPGYVVYNLASMATLPKWQMAALAFHEGIPGHHMQISIAQETKAIPDFRKYSFFTAYIEGWALYTELLSKEMGLYVDDLDEVGRITMELWRACRLVVDTGIHAKGWSRNRSVGYFVANTALTRDNVVREIDRYFVWPGQACAYQIGKNKILDLREQAKAKLGPRFDLRKYHDTVLENGGVPLPVLETIVADWVRASAAPA